MVHWNDNDFALDYFVNSSIWTNSNTNLILIFDSFTLRKHLICFFRKISPDLAIPRSLGAVLVNRDSSGHVLKKTRLYMHGRICASTVQTQAAQQTWSVPLVWIQFGYGSHQFRSSRFVSGTVFFLADTQHTLLFGKRRLIFEMFEVFDRRCGGFVALIWWTSLMGLDRTSQDG